MDTYRTIADLAATVELAAPFRSESLFQEKDLFTAGLDDVNIYRIPALIATPGDTLLAFCEARSRDDDDPLDLVLKRSLPVERDLQGVNGVSWPDDRRWLPMQVVLPGEGEAPVNPCPVLDRQEGKVWLCCRKVLGGLAANLGWVHGPLYLLSSQDDGATWSAPVEINDQVGEFLPGPGTGIQTRTGRLVIPGYDPHSAKVIYSDDHGRTWQAGGTIQARGDESQVVELADGTLVLNVRRIGCRHLAFSRDGGESWYEEREDWSLSDPSCMAAVVRYSDAAPGGRGRLLFANPAMPGSRTQLTVKLSYDEGRTWPVARMVHAGQAAYSSLAVLTDGSIGLLYETGPNHPYEKITFARFSLEWLSEGRDRVRPAVLPLELPLVWEFRRDPEEVGVEQGWAGSSDSRGWTAIRVNADWTSQGHDYHGVAWYRLRFAVPAEVRPGTRLALLFGAIDGFSQIYLNGECIAEDRLGPPIMSSRPLVVPLPRALAGGQVVELAVQVRKDEGRAGVWRPVCLVQHG
ncbi:MAG: exo-alpha-sialidase [Candidatus Latescibacterota bacterium]|jgi:sialidase-1